MGLAITKLAFRESVKDPRSGGTGVNGAYEFSTFDCYAISRDGPCYVVVDTLSNRACEYPVSAARWAEGAAAEEKAEHAKPVEPPVAPVIQPAPQPQPSQQWKGNGKHGGRR